MHFTNAFCLRLPVILYRISSISSATQTELPKRNPNLPEHPPQCPDSERNTLRPARHERPDAELSPEYHRI